MNAFPPDSQRPAYHEAGHATIGRVLTLMCGHATIEPNFNEMSTGEAITFDPYDCDTEWRKRGKWRPMESAWQGRIIAFMAGAEAEIEFFGHCVAGDGNDRDQITLMAEELLPAGVDWNTRESRLRAMTRMLVRRHRTRIERSKALLANITLSAKDLDRLVGRSIDDVKVNAPDLLDVDTAPNPAHREFGRTFCRTDRRVPCGLAATPL
jgi:hypothetical protein